MIYFVVRYRRSRNPNPAQIEGNVTLEALWTILPTVLVLVMFYYGWAGFKVMRDIPEGAYPGDGAGADVVLDLHLPRRPRDAGADRAPRASR